MSTFATFLCEGIPGKAAQFGSNSTAKCAFARATLRGVECFHMRAKA